MWGDDAFDFGYNAYLQQDDPLRRGQRLTYKFRLGICAFAAMAALSLSCRIASAEELSGRVLLASQPVVDSTVSLWAASAGQPAKLGETRTDAGGKFTFAESGRRGAVVYLIANGGPPRSKGDSQGVVLMTLLDGKHSGDVVINELTTVASAFTAARFIKNDSISGNPLGLRIAASNVPNLVDVGTGGWGHTLVDPLNSNQSTTLATFDTLASLITAFAGAANDSWRGRFFAASTQPGGATPNDTLDAMAGIARQSWTHAAELYGLFNEAYPQPKDGSRRSAPFVPYLAYVPSDFALVLRFAGGGVGSPGRLMFDADGNLWSGQNWMPGSQSGVVNSIGGGVVKLSPSGEALSPPILGFTGMGINGVGWGTGVTRDRVWASSFNGKLLVMDFNGKPVATEADLPFKKPLLGLMGVGVAANGDVWIADGSDNQLLYFPDGNIKQGRIVKVAGLKSPFDIVIDPQNRVWVSNSQSETVIRFPANDPTKVDTFKVGLIARALALDSKSNVWAVSNVSLDFPVPKVPDGASIMEQFEIMGAAMLKYPKTTGVISMIRPDGTQPNPAGYSGGGIDVPWGINIDGNDDVWAGNFSPLTQGVVLLAGDGTKGHPAGTKTGDVLHVFQSGSLQMLTDVSIDAAGNVWAANNWFDPRAATASDPARRTSTWGPGQGIAVIYGAAAPVKPPRMGVVQGY